MVSYNGILDPNGIYRRQTYLKHFMLQQIKYLCNEHATLLGMPVPKLREITWCIFTKTQIWP